MVIDFMVCGLWERGGDGWMDGWMVLTRLIVYYYYCVQIE